MISMELSDISVSYQSKSVLKSVSSLLYGGQLVSIIGPNGTGKTTLIKAIAKLIKFKGTIHAKNTDGTNILTHEIAYVPQMTVTTTDLSVFEMVLLGRVKDLSWKVEEIHLHAVTKILEELELIHLCYTPFSSLSGGQKQLVIMAQALVSSPKILLLDEPTSALDLRHQLQVLDIAKKYTKDTGAITIVVIHDLGLAARYSDYMILLNEGYSSKQGDPINVLDAHLLEKAYKVEVDVTTSKKGYTTITPIKPSTLIS
ncbi:ABC transporter ATP-binding protein [Anaerophilus nitritogenes]|uniref:ABC transporter ATP-binding protein n=1 Tax=Anaerophilus nitritogenes TaxID=2498136 RepID=UPI00101C79C6|nr:ABC transporter ATP-binding protein [Anaerophilus nitritogenes]